MYADGCAFVVCDTEEEQEMLFYQVVGGGPTKSNPYSGKACVYAATCNADGALEDENT